MKRDTLINRNIRAENVFLIQEDNPPEFVSIKQALYEAEKQELDLVKVAEKPDGVPVCKIIDYNKFLYQENKKKHKQEKHNKPVSVKMLMFRPVTGESDFNIKIKHAIEFLQKGHKVKITLKFKNRESTLRDFNNTILEKIQVALEPYSELDSTLAYTFREASFSIRPKR